MKGIWYGMLANLQTQEKQKDELRNLISTFENKMKDGNIYKNAEIAYDYYVTANKILDTNKFSGNIGIISKQLSDAINNMTPWERQYATADPLFSSSDNIPSGRRRAKGCVWAETNLEPYKGDTPDYPSSENTTYRYESGSTGSLPNNERWHAHNAFYYHNSVYLYDGVNSGDQGGTEIPFMVLYQARDSWRLRLYYIEPIYTAYGILNKWDCLYLKNASWNGSLGNRNFESSYYSPTTSGVISTSSSNKSNYYLVPANSSLYLSNKFKVNPDKAFPNGEYYCVAHPDRFMIGHFHEAANYPRWESNLKGYYSSTDKTYPNSSIYILNYKKFLDGMENAKTITANISNYRTGGLEDFFKAYKDAYEFNVLGYNWTYDQYNQTVPVSQCAERMENIVNRLAV